MQANDAGGIGYKALRTVFGRLAICTALLGPFV